MATSTVTTGIELESLSVTQREPSVQQTAGSDPAPHSTDAVLEASRLADTAAPEGGSGWAVVAGCAVVTWWFVGTSYSWGVIQGALVEQGLSSPATLSFIGSLSPAILAILATVNGGVTRRLGARKSGLLGVALLGAAEVLSSFSITNLAGLFMTAGVMLGLGMR